MQYEVTHKTTYTYSHSVFVEPHILRLTPRTDPSQTVHAYDLSIDPMPAGISRCLGVDGAVEHTVWFNGMTDSLSVTSHFIVDVVDNNPFDFIVYPDSASVLPMRYSPQTATLLQAYLEPMQVSDELVHFAHKIGQEHAYRSVPTIMAFMQHIHEHFSHTIREHGDPYPPHRTFLQRDGSCRDFAVLCMALLRTLGLATRFVSGYFVHEELEGAPELHAWVEVYIPGAGWRGFDPTNGIAAHGCHIVLASSADPDCTKPVTGTYRGDAQSAMKTDLSVVRLQSS